MTWNKTQKRDRWGQRKQTDRPPADWLQVDAPHLRIVSEENLAGRSIKNMAAARTEYDRMTHLG